MLRHTARDNPKTQDTEAEIKPEQNDSDDDCACIETRAVTRNGPGTPRPTPSVIHHGTSAPGTGSIDAARTGVSTATLKQRERAELQLELEMNTIKQKAVLARIDAEAEFALQRKAIEKRIAALDEQ